MTGAGTDLVDLRFARGAARLVLPRQQATPAEVTGLRTAVADELPAIDQAARAWTRLGGDLPPTTAQVVGRMGWVDANLEVVVGVLGLAAERLGERPPGTAQLLGAQLGGLLGLLSTRVLGQFVLPLAEEGQGRLVVVGPNVLDLARRSPDVATDLRRTVLLHEVAHRLQFDGVPWLGEHLRDLVGRYLRDTPTDASRVIGIVRRLPGAIVEALQGGGTEPLLHAVLSAAQVTTLDRAQALMSLLEGHGNATMRLGADGVVADPDRVDEALSQRRDDLSGKIVRTVTGMQRKARQYTEGEAFVRHVVDAADVGRLNRAFEAPELLPAPDEIADPTAWLARTA